MAEIIRPWAPTTRVKFSLKFLVEIRLKSESFKPLIERILVSSLKFLVEIRLKSESFKPLIERILVSFEPETLDRILT